MRELKISRREALRCFSKVTVAPLIGAIAGATGPVIAADPAPEPFIDTHFHLVNPRLPGIPVSTLLAPFEPARKPDGAQQLAKVIQAEMKAADVGQALCMPRHEVSDKDPLGIKEIQAMTELVPGVKLHPVGFVHPERFDRDHLALVEDVLKLGEVKGLKVYLGYLHYGPYHIGYRPYYKLAAKYHAPVIFHTGD